MKQNHRISTRNKDEILQLEAVEQASDILEKKLKLQHMNLSIQGQRQVGWAGSDAFHVGMFEITRGLVKVNFRNLNGWPLNKIIEIVGHEFRHAVQYDKGLLSLYGKYAGGGEAYKWMGDTPLERTETYDEQYSNWFKKPEEIDARIYQKPYSEIIFKDPSFSKYLPYLKTSVGKKVLKEDRKAGLAKLPFDSEGISTFTPKYEDIKLGKLWMHTSQIPKCKKFTKRWVKIVYTEYYELLKKQVFEPVMVEVTENDFIY